MCTSICHHFTHVQVLHFALTDSFELAPVYLDFLTGGSMIFSHNMSVLPASVIFSNASRFLTLMKEVLPFVFTNEDLFTLNKA